VASPSLKMEWGSTIKTATLPTVLFAGTPSEHDTTSDLRY
jgi:hypothetical protein